MTVIGLTGYARSGKDSVGRILVENHGFTRVAFGDVLKQVAEDLDPILELGTTVENAETYRAKVSELIDAYDGSWEAIKDDHPEARQYLVDLGNSLRRRIPNVETSWWLDSAGPGDNIVSTNVYHGEEIDRIRELGGFVCRVLRPGHKPANPDEARTGRHPVDATIYNDGGLDKLAVHVGLVLDFIREREAA